MVPKSKFCSYLQVLNGFQDDFSHWYFQPGMLFAAPEAWWQAGQIRSYPHEGVDFCGYVTPAGDVVAFTAGTKVPCLFDGEIVRIFDDFSGRSILVQHDFWVKKKRFYSLYAHVRPGKICCPGRRVRSGQRIAAIAPAQSAKVPAHLHLSTLLVQEPLPVGLNWETLHTLPEVELCSPLSCLELGLWYVYIVRCSDGSFYSGITTDLSRRLAEHNAAKGGARYTRARQPVALHYCELAAHRSAAAKRELFFKSMSHARKNEFSLTSEAGRGFIFAVSDEPTCQKR